MAGRSVYGEWLAKYGKTEASCRQQLADKRRGEAAKNRWQDPAYRALIKETTTGKKRTDEFRQTHKKKMPFDSSRTLLNVNYDLKPFVHRSSAVHTHPTI